MRGNMGGKRERGRAGEEGGREKGRGEIGRGNMYLEHLYLSKHRL